MTEIENLINSIAAEYAVPGWVARGIAFGESGLNPDAIATEPDGRQSVGLYQIHDIHGLSKEWRLVPENNIRWAMENSVGPAYRWIITESPAATANEVLAYIWQYGQRCAKWAIAGGVARAMEYLSRMVDEIEEEEEPMPSPVPTAEANRDAALDMVDEIEECLTETCSKVGVLNGFLIDRWPVGSAPGSPAKTIHLVMVTYFNQPPNHDYYNAMTGIPGWIDDWARPQGLVGNAWACNHVALPGQPGSYNLLSLTRAVDDVIGRDVPGPGDALYIFSQDERLELVVYGTLGGDWFDGPQFPSVSFFMCQGLHALAYDDTLPAAAAKGETWTRNKALGAIAHELGHNLAGLPCANAPHAGTCIMERWWAFPESTYEVDGYIYTVDPPPFTEGNEREAMIASGFMRRV